MLALLKKILLSSLCIWLFSCQEYNNKVDVSVAALLAKQISFEKQDTEGKKYAVGNTSLRVTDRLVQKLLTEADTAYQGRLLKLSERLASNKDTCEFTGNSTYPFLFLIEEKSLDSYDEDKVDGLFGVSCVEYDGENNTGLYYFSYACGSECGYSGFVIYEKDQNQEVNIIDVIYTGIS